MSKINAKELRKALKQCGLGNDVETLDQTPFVGVHHVHDWDHGYDAIYGYNGTRREFYADLRMMTSFLLDYIHSCCITEFIITPHYGADQFVFNVKKNDIYQEMYAFLRSYKIRRCSQSGIKLPINGNESVIEMILEGAFRDISRLYLFFPKRSVILVPNHHFDMPFFTQYFDQEKLVICELLKNYPELKYYERVAD